MNCFRLAFIFLLCLTCASCGRKAAETAAMPPAEVDVATPLTHTITEWDEFTGRFEAVARVDVRARVTGYLVEKRFRDGQMVKQGDVLFVIDQRPFEYEMQRAQAQYTLAKKSYERAVDLRKSQSVSQEIFDQRFQEYQVAEAALHEAELNLQFTEVQAPLDGKISYGFVDTGNLVSANETVLTRIVTIDPIHFVFEGSQTDVLKYARLDRAGKRPSSATNPNPIFIKLLDEDAYVHKGRMDFVDNIADPGTGTIIGRALVENKQGIIHPGFFGRAHLIGSGEYEAILLPERAINTDQSKKFVYVVNKDNQAQRVYITPGPVLDNGFVIIREGLRGDERVVVTGMQRIRTPQQVVNPVATTLEWQALPDMPDISTVPSLQDIAGETIPAAAQ